MKIDCDTCVIRGSACADCVVSFLTVAAGERQLAASDGRGPIEMDDEQAAAVHEFSRGGLVPPLRHLASGAA